MLNKIHGLPAHVLLIHAVVILFPLAAGMLVASAVWPAARRKLTWLTPALAFAVLALVPVTTNSGEWLQKRLPDTAAIEKHAHLGHDLLPWAVGIFALAAAVWLLDRRYDLSWRPTPIDRGEPVEPPPPAPADRGGSAMATLTRPAAAATARPLPVWVTAVVAVLAIGVSTGGVVQLVRIGDSGAKAVWGSTADLPVQSGSGGD
ncbi:MAG: hypothetical protein ABR571_13345 [Jatrophihabitans sp.]|uniref:hypothetical protein n=1 Tax=Jatrophihabitans sp. TaxID=1932789 RepID=UPI003914DF98